MNNTLAFSMQAKKQEVLLFPFASASRNLIRTKVVQSELEEKAGARNPNESFWKVFTKVQMDKKGKALQFPTPHNNKPGSGIIMIRKQKYLNKLAMDTQSELTPGQFLCGNRCKQLPK